MIDTMPMHPQRPSLLSLTKLAHGHESVQLSPPLVSKNSVDTTKMMMNKIPSWRITPPLKKRHIRISVEDHDTLSKPLIATKSTKKTLTKPSTIIKKRSVRFSRVIKTRTLKKERTNLTLAEQANMWYQNNDYAAMDQDCLNNIAAYNAVQGDIGLLPLDRYCVRGLEMKSSPHIHRLRRLRASITVRAVVERQAHLRYMKSNNDEEALAHVSRLYTQQAKLRARELGFIDSVEAERC